MSVDAASDAPGSPVPDEPWRRNCFLILQIAEYYPSLMSCILFALCYQWFDIGTQRLCFRKGRYDALMRDKFAGEVA
jgi:hypothetical protein